MKKILVLNGPNLNILGSRETSIYGSKTLKEINNDLISFGLKLNVLVEAYQSNHEGELVSRIQDSRNDGTKFIVINAGAYTHTSLAIRDAIISTDLPVIEIHLSNIYKRELFRQHSYLSDISIGVVAGLGDFGYKTAIRFASMSLDNKI